MRKLVSAFFMLVLPLALAACAPEQTNVSDGFDDGLTMSSANAFDDSWDDDFTESSSSMYSSFLPESQVFSSEAGY